MQALKAAYLDEAPERAFTNTESLVVGFFKGLIFCRKFITAVELCHRDHTGKDNVSTHFLEDVSPSSAILVIIMAFRIGNNVHFQMGSKQAQIHRNPKHRSIVTHVRGVRVVVRRGRSTRTITLLLLLRWLLRGLLLLLLLWGSQAVTVRASLLMRRLLMLLLMLLLLLSLRRCASLIGIAKAGPWRLPVSGRPPR